MRVEMQRRQNLPPPGFTTNATTNERPPLYSPSSNMDPAQNPPSTPAQNLSVLDLTTQNPQYAYASYQNPPPPQKQSFSNTTSFPKYPPSNHSTTAKPESKQKLKCIPPPNSSPPPKPKYNPQPYPQNYQTT
ncbi:uncharacterized protein [Solanum lycopersicum]|uniref:uncharacterized protein n=1 Tax=Solanum lycopersicum TaxID=4081 RepID=UPI003748F368